jgi:hypothetical protein
MNPLDQPPLTVYLVSILGLAAVTAVAVTGIAVDAVLRSWSARERSGTPHASVVVVPSGTPARPRPRTSERAVPHLSTEQSHDPTP